jgi:hypothetical protein
MRQTRVVGILAAALLVVSGLAAAQASAIEFVWKVNGSTLEAGKEKTLLSKAKGSQILKGSAFGIAVEITCTEVVTTGAIIGGVPGTSTETVEYKSCTVQKPAKCKVSGGAIKTNLLKDEIVEGLGASKEKALILFSPKEGTKFAEPKLEGGLLCQSIPVEGTVLAEANPQKSEVENGVLVFEAASKEYKNSKGESKTAGLTLAGTASTVKGEVETMLSSGEKFGAF